MDTERLKEKIRLLEKETDGDQLWTDIFYALLALATVLLAAAIIKPESPYEVSGTYNTVNYTSEDINDSQALQIRRALNETGWENVEAGVEKLNSTYHRINLSTDIQGRPDLNQRYKMQKTVTVTRYRAFRDSTTILNVYGTQGRIGRFIQGPTKP
jgi:hypothetical protein